jgi:hypothetical protein
MTNLQQMARLQNSSFIELQSQHYQRLQKLRLEKASAAASSSSAERQQGRELRCSIESSSSAEREQERELSSIESSSSAERQQERELRRDIEALRIELEQAKAAILKLQLERAGIFRIRITLF